MKTVKSKGKQEEGMKEGDGSTTDGNDYEIEVKETWLRRCLVKNFDLVP